MSRAGLQQNNYSPMGQGQPSSGKTGQKKNFMSDAGLGTQPIEPVAPGIPAAAMSAPPQSFQGQGTGWRGLDVTPVSGPVNANNFSGFNLDRAMRGGDPNSTKDAFARWANGLGPLAGLDKAGVGNLINQNLESARKAGLNILDVVGDKILIDAKEHGPVWNDVVINAGGANPQWGWQPELAGTLPRQAPANQMYQMFQQQFQSPEKGSMEEFIAALLSQNQELI